MLGLGIAVIAFGWSFAQQYFQNQQTKKYHQDLESSVSQLSNKIQTIDKNLKQIRKQTTHKRKNITH